MIEPKKIEKGPLSVVPGGQTDLLEYEAEKHYIHKINDFIQAKYDIRYNVMTLDIEFKPKSAEKYQDFTERTENDLWIDMNLSGVKANGKETGTGLIRRIVNSNTFTKEFHPLQDYLTTLKWDGKDHFKKLAATLFLSNEIDLSFEGRSQSQIFPTILKRWMLNSAAIALNLPVAGQGHVMLILEGAQGRGKTTWLNALCPPKMESYRVCGHIDPRITEVNTSNLLAEKWFINIDDQLQNLFSKDFNSIKSLITSPEVTNRKSYERSSKLRQRTASFLASVNGREIFTDSENRRYVCFCIDNSLSYCYDKNVFDKIDIEQVWAQIVALLKKGEKYFYTAEEMRIINSMNLMFNQTKPEEEWLMRCFAPSDPQDPEAVALQSSEMLSIAKDISKLNLQSFWWNKAFDKYKFASVAKKMKKYGDTVRRVYYVRKLYREDPFRPDEYTFDNHE